jgi:hypothetical protein
MPMLWMPRLLAEGAAMFRKILLSAIGLGAAVGAPVVYYSASDSWRAVRSAISSPPGADAPQPGEPTSLPPPAQRSDVWWSEAAPVRDLGEVLRFDVTPGWVIQRWPRVSTGLAKPQLEGYRVPLVTGATPADLAGALTYYFNSHQQVQEITFCGTTGDLSKLVLLLSTRYHFTRRLTNDPGLVIYEVVNSAQQPSSILRIQAAHVVKASQPHRRFLVELVIERPRES